MRHAVRHLIVSGLAIASVFLAGGLAMFTRAALRGQNRSDVGVPMYNHDALGTGMGSLIFAGVLVGCLYAVQRTLSDRLPWLPYAIAGTGCLLGSPLLLWLLFW
jgi:hypothetical protein